MKRLLFGISPERVFSHELSLTALRVFAGLAMAFGHGWGKLPPPQMLVDGVGAMGFPQPEIFAWLAALSEFGGGLLLAVGLATRPAALAVAVTMAVAAFGVHAADPFAKKEMALLFFFISLVFVFRGSGRISFDRFI